MRKGVFAETHHSCLETESLLPFLLGVQLSWKTLVALGHGSLRAKMGQKEEVQDFGAEALDGAGGPERAGGWGACTHVCTHTSIRGGVHRSANVRRICHLGHCLLSDGGSGTLRTQRVLKTVPCPPVTSCQDPGCALWPLLERTHVLTCVQVHIAGTGPPHALGSALRLTSSECLLPGPIEWDHCTCISMHACAPH